jgi:hypothetical protein
MSGNGTTIPVLNGGFVTLDTQINGQNQSQLYFRRFEGAKATSDGSFYSLEPAQTTDPSIRINKFDSVGNVVATGYLYDTVINQPSGGGGGGATGFQGPTGPAGLNGTNGTNGTNGVDGSPGPTGPAGTNGEQGPTGPAGINGTNGTNGEQGPTGPVGTNGSQGPTGPAGANGSQGPTGPVGLSKQISYIQNQNVLVGAGSPSSGYTATTFGSTFSVSVTGIYIINFNVTFNTTSAGVTVGNGDMLGMRITPIPLGAGAGVYFRPWTILTGSGNSYTINQTITAILDSTKTYQPYYETYNLSNSLALPATTYALNITSLCS